MTTRRVLVFAIVLCLTFTSRLIWASQPQPPGSDPTTTAQSTHVVVSETPYYTTSPAQARPPDGKFEPGTGVRVLREAGSYVLVRTETGIRAYVAADAIKPKDRSVNSEKPGNEGNDMPTVIAGNNAFAVGLYARLKGKTSENIFFSPYSISTALAMTYAGTASETRTQMAEVLHFTVPESELHEAMNRLREVLRADKEVGYQLRTANRLWGQKGFEFLPDFLETTRRYYGAELGIVDFARETETARREINEWVEKETEEKIQDLLAPGVLTPLTRLVLTNAIYFKGSWQYQFSTDATEDAPFHLSAQQDVAVPMMQQTERFGYRATDDLRILEMPYGKGELSMFVLLPKEIDGLPQLEKKLTEANLRDWTRQLRRQKVIVSLPRFKMASQFSLNEALKAMGMTLAFDARKADFSGMSRAEGTTEGDLYITAVIHKAFVDVNEQGTEAAAATGVMMGLRSARPEQPATFRADHPFLYLICDNQTSSILFMGRVVNPKE